MQPFLKTTLDRAQLALETCYLIRLPERAKDFCSIEHRVPTTGLTLCQSDDGRNLEISLLLDRDYFSAAPGTFHPTHYSVIFEELSHFFTLGVNHHRGRQITSLELEAQSEIDRLLCCRSLDPALSTAVERALRDKLFYESYPDPEHEKARQLAMAFLGQLSSTKPAQWQNKDLEKISRFFNSTLAEKFSLARSF